MVAVIVIVVALVAIGLFIWFFTRDGKKEDCRCSLNMIKRVTAEGSDRMTVGTSSYSGDSRPMITRVSGADILHDIRLESNGNVTAVVAKNIGTSEVSGTYRLTAGNSFSEATVVQESSVDVCECLSLGINSDDVNIDWEGDDVIVPYTNSSDSSINVEIVGDNNWLDISVGGENIMFKARKPNLYNYDRNESVNICIGDKVCRTIRVVQSHYDYDIFDELLSHFSEVAAVKDSEWARSTLMEAYTEAKFQYFGLSTSDRFNLPKLYVRENFPSILDYYGEKENEEQAFGIMCSWMFAMILSEVLPEKRDRIYQLGYDYMVKGRDIPTYGYSFDSDVNVARLVGSTIYAATRNDVNVKHMREELGGSMITYEKEIDETYVNLRPFMPQAPGPYLKEYNVDDRKGKSPNGEIPGGYPVGESTDDHNLKEDAEINEFIVDKYNIDDDVYRQDVIQSISDKETCSCHLFGDPRTVSDKVYGNMTFNPVFGKHNIGVRIPDDGAIADLINLVAEPCSKERNNFLSQQYGRIRPGQGSRDGSANPDPYQQILCDYDIEEGDGCRTGYYNKEGDYISEEDGKDIGDYCTYYKSRLFANSYPSGHSAFIWAAALVLIEVMPDRADKIMKAANAYAANRTVARFHWTSDTIHGRVVGSVLYPIEHATTNLDFTERMNRAKEEYRRLI